MAHKPPHLDYTVGWICVLRSEFTAAKKLLDNQYEELFGGENDDNLYTLGRMGHFNVVIASLPEGSKGTNAAATIATRMMGSFPRIKVNLLVGIGGGLPNGENDIRLGDVVVSVPHGEYGGVVQYDMGKSMKDGFRRNGYLNAPDEKLLAVLIRMPDRLESHPSEVYPGEEFDQLYHDHNSEVTCGKCDEQGRVKRAPGGRNRGPHVFYGTIASGNDVIKDAAMRDVLIKNHGVLCVEMEAAGLMNSSFRCLVIRGISDYADSHKNDKWQDYAAATAARYAKEFLNAVPPSVVRDPISTEGMY